LGGIGTERGRALEREPEHISRPQKADRLLQGTLRRSHQIQDFSGTCEGFIDVLDKLGLKLETQKAIVNMLFVDHVEVPDLEN